MLHSWPDKFPHSSMPIILEELLPAKKHPGAASGNTYSLLNYIQSKGTVVQISVLFLVQRLLVSKISP